MNILIIFLSLGLVMRGILYYIVSFKSMDSKFHYLSITNNESMMIRPSDRQKEYVDNNKIAGKAYVYLGLIFFFMYLIIVLLFPLFVAKHYILCMISILIIDYSIKILVSIKLKIKEWEMFNPDKK